MDIKTYIIGGIREGAASVTCEVIAPSGEVKKLPMTKKIWERFTLSTGDVISTELYSQMAEASERCEAVTKALRYLTDHSLSYKALSDKLKRFGFSGEAVESALALVKRRGLIDEEGDACDIALKLARSKRRGHARITAELAAKGYSSSVAKRAADSVPKSVYDEALRAAVAKKCASGVPSDKKERDRVIASLVRSGFSVSHVIDVLGELE